VRQGKQHTSRPPFACGCVSHPSTILGIYIYRCAHHPPPSNPSNPSIHPSISRPAASSSLSLSLSLSLSVDPLHRPVLLPLPPRLVGRLPSPSIRRAHATVGTSHLNHDGRGGFRDRRRRRRASCASSIHPPPPLVASPPGRVRRSSVNGIDRGKRADS
jgi:hypothetical protein